MIDVFDRETKIAFRDENEPAYIKFGSPLDKDLAVGIRTGQMKLQGYATYPGCGRDSHDENDLSEKMLEAFSSHPSRLPSMRLKSSEK
jgi:hypothetical protein